MMAEKKVVKEDGHTDVASAKRQCKTAMEDAQAIIGVLDGMNNEDALPTWWTNKLAIAANSMNKLNDYLSNPTEQKEEVELDEKSQYGPDIKGEISQLQKMLKGLERGKKTPGRGFAKMKIKELIADLEQRQAQDDAVIKMRGEEVELDEETIEVGDYETKHYDMCPGAVALYKDLEPTDTVVKAAKLQDQLFGLEKKVINAKSATQDDLDKAEKMATDIMALAKEMGKEKEHNYIKGHVSKIKELVEEIQMEDLDNLIEEALDEAPKMKYALVGKDMKIYSMGSDERDLRLDRRSLEKRFKDVAPLKMARLKTAQKIGDTVEKSQLKEETVNEHTHYKMEPFGVSRSLVDSVKAVLAGKPQEEALDKVNPKAVKKKFDDRKDKDIDNDGDVDDSDEYLHKRRKAISKAMKDEEKDDKKAKEKKDEKNGKKEPIEIDPEIKEEAEGEMTDAQMKRREEIVKELKKKEDDFKERYGDKWKEVMYATATKMAMKEAKK